ncbi:MAG: hypothetical protein ABJD07_04385 [Gemmatimonadaceae bacterium]
MTSERARRLAGAAALSLSAAGGARGVAAQQYFGMNQVQYDHFTWRIIETEHFFIHYYPQERQAAHDAARMAERAYGRLSRILGHDFREKKPIVVFASRADFGQNNVTGDLGEGTGGVTEPLRHRMLLPFTGDYASFEQVLTHEMVHEFQFDVFARGKAGNGLTSLAQANPPLWFMEGMAEYLSIGPYHPHTATWIRDAALNASLPSIAQMTERPDKYFPYRFGESLWAYVGKGWGDEVIGPILQGATTVGVERAIRRELGRSLADLSDDWQEAMREQYLPEVAQLERARTFSEPLLTRKRTGGEVFVAPALSPDGRYIAFVSNGNFLKGEVFTDLWLGDATTGKRITRLVKSQLDPDTEELQILYSQSAFSPDGRLLAFTALSHGKDVLYLLDVERRKTVEQIELPLEVVTSPTWSPDGKRLAFSGSVGGITDLFMVDADGSHFRQLTRDTYGDLMPQWSPDGETIAFASDRGPGTDLSLLRFARWRISLYHVGDGRVETIPGQDGLNINPMWAPDGKSLAYVSSRTGIQNVFLYDFTDATHYQLTNVVGGVSSFTEYSPVISWARGRDALAFTLYENGEYTVWMLGDPRSRKREPFTAARPALVAQRGGTSDTTLSAAAIGGNINASAPLAFTPAPSARPAPPAADTGNSLATSLYRTPSAFRLSGAAPSPGEARRSSASSVAAVLDSAALALPDTLRFKDYRYRIAYSPEYIARPTVGYARDAYTGGVFGGTTIILSDLLSDHHLAFSAEVNGRISEAMVYAAYTDLSRRLQYSAGLYQQPYYFSQGATLTGAPGNSAQQLESDIFTRYIERQAFGVGIYPFDRFTRGEVGLRFTSLERADLFISRGFNTIDGSASAFVLDSTTSHRAVNYLQPFVAYVSDNTLFGYTSPIMGRRFRLQATPTVGDFRWLEYLADYRRYDPIIFNYLWIATRGLASVSTGRDADSLRKYIGYPELVRGYDRYTYVTQGCSASGTPAFYKCSSLLGSRLAIANAELRFPIFRRVQIGSFPIPIPPIEGLVFYDAGVVWFGGQTLRWNARAGDDVTKVRTVMRSYGGGLRVNVFNFAILRWDYARPLDTPDRRWTWQFTFGPSY